EKLLALEGDWPQEQQQAQRAALLVADRREEGRVRAQRARAVALGETRVGRQVGDPRVPALAPAQPLDTVLVERGLGRQVGDHLRELRLSPSLARGQAAAGAHEVRTAE